MSREKWVANRIGFVNYWYYDEQIYEFSDGRMLLRGSNGSGKSVTMQSVLPVFSVRQWILSHKGIFERRLYSIENSELVRRNA